MKIVVTGGENKAVQIRRGANAFLLQKDCVVKAVGETVFLFDKDSNLILSGRFNQFELDKNTFSTVDELIEALTGPDYFFGKSTGGGGGGLEPGTAVGQLLRWDGTDWTPWSTWRAVDGADSIVDPGQNFGLERQYESGGQFVTETVGSIDGQALAVQQIVSATADPGINFVKNKVSIEFSGVFLSRDSDNDFEPKYTRGAKCIPICKEVFREVSSLGQKAFVYQNDENFPQFIPLYATRYDVEISSPATITMNIRDENSNIVFSYSGITIAFQPHISQPTTPSFPFLRLEPGWRLQFEVTDPAVPVVVGQTVNLISKLLVFQND